MTNSELMLNIINTIFSGFSVIFIIFGWIIPYKQSQKQQKNQRNYEKATKVDEYYKNRIDEQISKLYVPLYSLSMENKMQFNVLLKKLNRNYVFAKGKTINNLNENDKFLWLDFAKNHFVPNLNHMKDILNNNIHLIFDSELPFSYQRFMEYTLKINNDLELYLNHANIDYSNFFVDDNYPNDFDIYINKTLDKLLQLQNDYLIQNNNENIIISQSNFDINISNIELGETVILFDHNDRFPYLFNSLYNEKISITSSQFSIGKDISCDYILNYPTISRKHLMIIKEGDDWYITNFLSSNGTYLNNKLIKPNSKTLLCEGDIIKIANVEFTFHL